MFWNEPGSKISTTENEEIGQKGWPIPSKFSPTLKKKKNHRFEKPKCTKLHRSFVFFPLHDVSSRETSRGENFPTSAYHVVDSSLFYDSYIMYITALIT